MPRVSCAALPRESPYSQMLLLCQRTELTERPRPLCPRTVVARQHGRERVCVSVCLYYESVCTSTLPTSQSAAEQGLASSTGITSRPLSRLHPSTDFPAIRSLRQCPPTLTGSWKLFLTSFDLRRCQLSRTRAFDTHWSRTKVTRAQASRNTVTIGRTTSMPFKATRSCVCPDLMTGCKADSYQTFPSRRS